MSWAPWRSFLYVPTQQIKEIVTLKSVHHQNLIQVYINSSFESYPCMKTPESEMHFTRHAPGRKEWKRSQFKIAANPPAEFPTSKACLQHASLGADVEIYLGRGCISKV